MIKGGGGVGITGGEGSWIFLNWGNLFENGHEGSKGADGEVSSWPEADRTSTM